MIPFDPLKVPLHGLRLVEASAGTGKTYTIALLYLRLLLEQGLTPEQILVVTYTRAATAELKARIRDRIAEALKVLKGGGQPDPALQAVLARHLDAEPRLRAALLEFDRAKISTIHGFAQRVLQETAFETAQPFEFDVSEDDRDRIATVVTDFWTRTFYSMPIEEARLVLARFSLSSAMRFAREVARRQDAPRLVQAGVEDGLSGTLDSWWAARKLAVAHFEPSELRPILETLNRRRYTERRIADWLQTLPEVEPHSVKPEMLELLRADGLVTRKGQPEPAHPFFDAVAQWHDAHTRVERALSGRVMRVRSQLADYVVDHLNDERGETRSFDDLLRELAAVCEGPRGEALVQGLRSDYRAALIDEFQDTDPLQYRIFKRVFSPLSLFLIGDPKQAIYGFRGADMYAYLTAAREAANQRYGMAVNYRSSPEIIAATERLFLHCEDPFVVPEVRFQPVRPAPGAADRVEHDPLGAAALTFLLHRSDKVLSRQDARRSAADTTARLIANALASGMRLEGRAVRAGDFAVLSRSNSFALAVQTALRLYGVPAVFRGDRTVFSSFAAAELQRVMVSILEPSDQGLLRGALLSDLAGVSADDLLTDNGEILVQHAQCFSSLRARWVERGFMDAFRAFLSRYRIEARLMSAPGGDRTLTDLLHAAELLHRAEYERGLGPSGLTDWFASARHDPDGSGYGAAATIQMRLETDEPSVELYTIHTAKGLEFPLVVCPELWHSSFAPSPKPGPLIFHREDDLVLDLAEDPPPEHLDAADREWRAENQRLLYVALTRAVYRLYIPWGDFAGADASPLAHLLGGTDVSPVVGGPIHAVDAASLPATVRERAPVQPNRRPRRFDRTVRVERATTSYSAWVADANAQHFTERDIDAQSRTDDDGCPALLASLPPGARTGQLLHTVLERTDMRSPDPETVPRILAEYSSPSRWNDEIQTLIEAVRHAPLQLASGIRHSLVECSAAQPELEFTLPLRPRPRWQFDIAEALVREGGVFEKYAEPFSALEVHHVAGYLRGFIDWIGDVRGYGVVVDYKSNLLDGYDARFLETAMCEHHYVLQALVYSVTLRRQLEKHGRTECLGGAHYLFLRGLDDHGRGVCSLHPSPNLLSVFESALLGDGP